jgi:L-asparagine transporter-like permease
MSTGNLSESSTSITKSIDNVKRIIVFFLIFVSIAAVLIFTPMNDVISQTSPIISSQAQDTHVFNHSDSLVIVSCVGDSITKGKKF